MAINIGIMAAAGASLFLLLSPNELQAEPCGPADQQPNIQTLVGKASDDATEISKLKINQLLRQTPIQEIIGPQKASLRFYNDGQVLIKDGDYLNRIFLPAALIGHAKVIKTTSGETWAVIPQKNPTAETVDLLLYRFKDGKQIAKKAKLSSTRAAVGSFNYPLGYIADFQRLEIVPLTEGGAVLAIDPTHYHFSPQTIVITLSRNGAVRREMALSEIGVEKLMVQKSADEKSEEFLIIGPKIYNYSAGDRREAWTVARLNSDLVRQWTTEPSTGPHGKSIGMIDSYISDRGKIYLNLDQAGLVSYPTVYEIDAKTGKWKIMLAPNGQWATHFKVQSDGSVEFWDARKPGTHP